MKRTRQILSIFLSLCIAVSCMVGFSIPVNAATTDTITITANTNEGTYFRVSGTYNYKDETYYGIKDEITITAKDNKTKISKVEFVTHCTLAIYSNTDYQADSGTFDNITRTSLVLSGVNASSVTVSYNRSFNSLYFKSVKITFIHEHSFTYSASGATITATCGNPGCTLTPAQRTITISAPTSLTYNGSGKAASLSTGYSTTAFTYVPSITYKKNGVTITGTPTDVGTYVATVSAGASSSNCKTASVEYTIAAATMTISAPNVSTAYDGNAHGITVTPTTPSSGYTIKYGTTAGTYDLDASPTITNVAESPKTVYYKVTSDNDNYLDYEGSATITITNASQDAPDAPTLASATTTTITLTAVDGCEYSKDGTNWQTSNVFTDLEPGTSYTFYQRKTAITNYAASAPSAGTVISTNPHTHILTYSASGATITATCSVDDCPFPNSRATLTIAAPLHTNLNDGKDANAVITDEKGIQGTSTVQYQTKTGSTWGDATETAPTDPGTYKASITVGGATAYVVYDIGKEAPTITTPPTASEITYGQTLADSILTGGAGSVAGSFAWKEPTTKPAVLDSGTTAYTVVFTPDNTSLYAPVEMTVTLTVNKADITAPTGLTAIVGQTLADVTLPAGWVWDDDTTSVGSVGAKTFPASYTDTTGNYYDAANVDVTVNVKPKAVPVTAVTLDKNTLELEIDDSNTLTATVTPANATNAAVTWTSDSPGVATVVNGAVTAVSAGTATITATAGGKSATCIVTVKAKKSDGGGGGYTPVIHVIPTVTTSAAETTAPAAGTSSDETTAPVNDTDPGDDDNDDDTTTPPDDDDDDDDDDDTTVLPDDDLFDDDDFEGGEQPDKSVDADVDGTAGGDPDLDMLVYVDTVADDGNFLNTTDPDRNFGGAALRDDANYLEKAVCTPEDKEAIANGEEVSTWLEVNETEPTEKEKKAVKDKIKTLGGNFKVGMYFDASLFKKVGNGKTEQVHRTNGLVTVSLAIPDSLINTDPNVVRTYYIAKIHNGKVTLLPCKFSKIMKRLSFMTDEFSTYAIITEDTPAEADTNPVTGVSAGFGLLAVCALTAGAALALKKRK